MTCQACSARIEKVLSKQEGIENVYVNSLQGYGNMDVRDDIDTKKIIDLIEKSGFEVPKEIVKFDIEGMTCQACSARIEKVLSKKKRIEKVYVKSLKGYGNIDVRDDIDTKKIIDLIEKSGFEVPKEIVKFDIEGMTCQACSARIEKVLSKLPVEEVSINLLQN